MNRRVTVELHIGSLLLGLAGGAVVMWVVEIFKSIFGGKGVINAGTGQAGTASENATVINAQGNASVTTIGTQNVQSVAANPYAGIDWWKHPDGPAFDVTHPVSGARELIEWLHAPQDAEGDGRWRLVSRDADGSLWTQDGDPHHYEFVESGIESAIRAPYEELVEAEIARKTAERHMDSRDMMQRIIARRDLVEAEDRIDAVLTRIEESQ